MYDVAIDFDDTIMNRDTLEPIEGALDALNYLIDSGKKIYVLTARKDLMGAVLWLQRYGIEVLVTNTKFPAKAYVDDRGVKFDGDWDGVLMELEHGR